MNPKISRKYLRKYWWVFKAYMSKSFLSMKQMKVVTEELLKKHLKNILHVIEREMISWLKICEGNEQIVFTFNIGNTFVHQ